MANEASLDEVVGKKAYDQLSKLDVEMNRVYATYIKVAAEMAKGLSFNPSSLTELAKKNEDYSNSMKNISSLTIEYNDVQKKRAAIEAELAKAARDYAEADLLRVKTDREKIKLSQQIENQNKRRKASEEEIASAMSTQAKSIREAEEQNKKLRQAVKDVSDTDVNASKARSEYNKKIDENTKYVKLNTDSHTQQKMTIGDYKNQILDAIKSQGSFNDRLKNTISIINQQKGAIMLAAGAFAAYKVASFALESAMKFVSDSINTIKEFEKANSVLAAILGTTSKDIKELTDDARRLGETTSATASQVTELQTELAKLGFTRNEILASTEAVLNFALATGASLADAASLAGAAIRIFGADAEDTDRYVSAMAVSTDRSALSFSQLATAIPIVAPVAKAFGFEIEDVLTLLAKLSDAGFDASMAATATRNIFLNLADSNGKLAKALGGPVKSLGELQSGLIELRKRGVDLNEMLELTDKRSVAAFARFVSGADDLDKFKESITDVNEEMKKSAEERVNNLSGSLDKLSSAWEGLMLTFSGSAGVLKSTVDWLTKIVGLTMEMVSTDQENADRMIEQSKRKAVEDAKRYKEEEFYYRNIQAIKESLIKQGVSEVDAEKDAASQVLANVKARYDKEMALAEDYKNKNLKLQEDQKNASLFKQGAGLDMTDREYSNQMTKTFELYNTAISGAEEYRYVLEKLDKYINSPKESTTGKNGYKTDKQIKEEKKAAKERLRIQQELQQSIIDITDEGYKKERLQLTLNYQKKIDAVKGNSLEEIETRKNLGINMSNALLEFDRKADAERSKQDISNRIAIAEKGSLEEMDAKVKLLLIQRDEELRIADKTGVDKLLIESKYGKQINDLYNEFDKQNFDRLQAQGGIEQTERQKQLSDDLLALEQSYAKGKIKKEAYEKEKADIQYKYAVETLQSELKLLEGSLDLFSGDERLNMEYRIAKLRVELAKSTNEKIMSEEEKNRRSYENLQNAKIDLLKQAVSTMGDIGNSLFERQIQNIDQEIEDNRILYDERISNIDSLAEKEVITKEEAEARKRAAEEESAAKNKELEKKKAELQTKQAKFQKAMNVAQIIANTAGAIMKTLEQGGIFATPLIAVISAIGALQLATVLAQPIPKYAKGTDSHPGGLAMVGDGGKHEAIVMGKDVYITPNKPTLLPLPKGAEVLPDIYSREFYDRFMDNSYFMTHNEKGNPVKVINNFDVNGIIDSNKKVEKAINTQSRMMSKIARQGRFENYKNSRVS